MGSDQRRLSKTGEFFPARVRRGETGLETFDCGSRQRVLSIGNSSLRRPGRLAVSRVCRGRQHDGGKIQCGGGTDIRRADPTHHAVMPEVSATAAAAGAGKQSHFARMGPACLAALRPPAAAGVRADHDSQAAHRAPGIVIPHRQPRLVFPLRREAAGNPRAQPAAKRGP